MAENDADESEPNSKVVGCKKENNVLEDAELLREAEEN